MVVLRRRGETREIAGRGRPQRQIGRRDREVGSVQVRNTAGEDVVHEVMFAFAFHAFWPEGEWMLGE